MIKKNFKTVEIPLKKIDDFKNYPFRVLDDDDMLDLIESINRFGQLVPVILRKRGDRYEMVSGYRRKRALEFLGKESINSVVMNLTESEALILMTESNMYRHRVGNGEIALSLQLKEQTDTLQRNFEIDEALMPLIDFKMRKERKRNLIAIRRLIPELLEFVNEDKMRLSPAYSISFLDEESQRDLVDIIDETLSFPSYSQAVRLKKAFENGKLNYEFIYNMMCELKPNQKNKIRFESEEIRQFVPREFTDRQVHDFILHQLKNIRK